VAAINAEVRIGRQDNRISKRFSHANEASVSYAHGNIRVFLDEFQDWLYVLDEIESDDQGTAAKKCVETWRAA
jgi:hypothetical protein